MVNTVRLLLLSASLGFVADASALTYTARVPTSCDTYASAQQNRDAYYFDASGLNPVGTLSWLVPGRQYPLTPLYETRYMLEPGIYDYYSTTSANSPLASGQAWRELTLQWGFEDADLPLKLHGNGKSIVGFIEGKCQPGTSRLSRFYSKTYGTHFYTLNGLKPSPVITPTDSLWTREETYEGYIWTTRIPESEPLRRCNYRQSGVFSSRIITQTQISQGGLEPGYVCESTPLGYVLSHDNYYFSNTAKRESNFTQRCNLSGYATTRGCYPLPSNDRTRANLGGGFFQPSSQSGGRQIQQVKFNIQTPDFFESGTNSHMAFGLLSSLTVSGSYTNPVLNNLKAVIIGFGPHQAACGSLQPGVWLEPLGSGSYIPGTCGKPGGVQFVLRNRQSYNVTFEVSREGYAKYKVVNAADPNDQVTSPLLDIRTAFGSEANFPRTLTGYFGTATENVEHDFTVHIRNYDLRWRDAFSF